MEDEDSFNQLKNELENMPDYQELQAPHKPLNPYMMFNFERACQQRRKRMDGNINHDNSLTITEIIAKSWNQLSSSQKRLYQKNYETKLTKYNILHDQYLQLSGKKKILNPYLRFFRKLYGIYEAQYDFEPKQITKLIQNSWSKLPREEKEVYEAEYEQEKEQLKIRMEDKEKKILIYNHKLAKYKEDQSKQKDQILTKYKLNLQTLLDFQNINTFIRNEKNLKKREQRKRIRELQREKEEERIKENGLKLYFLKEYEIMELKQQKERIMRQERERKNQEYAKPTLKESEVIAALPYEKTLDSAQKDKVFSDEESPKPQKTKKIHKVSTKKGKKEKSSK